MIVSYQNTTRAIEPSLIERGGCPEKRHLRRGFKTGRLAASARKNERGPRAFSRRRMQFQAAAHRVHAFPDAEQSELRREGRGLLRRHGQQIKSHPLVFDDNLQISLTLLDE